MEIQSSELVSLKESFEEEELNASNGVASLDTYKKLILVYLIETDLTNAKFLWKRIPTELKVDKELTAIWKIGQCLWKRDFVNIYKEIDSQEWCEDVKRLVEKLCCSLRKRLTSLIAKSYSVIKFSDLCQLIGITEEQVAEIAISNSWIVDNENKVVRITHGNKNEVEKDNDTDNSSVHLMQRLTNYVSFLEN